MKTYFVFIKGVQVPGMIIRAAGINTAEKKAKKTFPSTNPSDISVEYTEL